jgi:hypothetical protein
MTHFDSKSYTRKGFLDLFPINHRGTITNRFCFALRDGYMDSHSIVRHVVFESRRLRDSDAIRMIQENPAAAHEFADYALEWEQLPRETKKQIKQKRSALHRKEYLKAQPATEKQLNYLKQLGHCKEVKSKWEAMQLIDALTNR